MQSPSPTAAGKEMGSGNRVQELVIRGWHPHRLNEWDGRHWSVRRRMKAEDGLQIAVASRNASLRKADTTRRVSVEFTITKGKRAWDCDACWKSLLDAMTGCGLLVDDSPKWCVLGTVRFRRGDLPETKITLEDMPDGPE